MPLYEFRCSGCRTVFEKSASMKNPPTEANCPSCDAMSLRYYSSMNFSFKGGKPTTFDIDYIVGRESEKRWKNVEDRLAVKNELRKKDKENFILNVSGDYVSSDAEVKNTNREILNTNMKPIDSFDSLKKETINKS